MVRWGNQDAIERQLSHTECNNVRAAYIHTSEHLDERRYMVQWWADYLDENKLEYITPYDYGKNTGNNVVEFNFKGVKKIDL